MFEFFHKLWDIEMSKVHFLLDYWYVYLIIIVLWIAVSIFKNN